eukprot:TRINITY_DN27_c0_g1_i1.p1 TRINITY_DN27_c0_g1~~TRINITY_DN27_c0_g1_i1.p1  ORF type:complete len:836 (-),score=120.23 TRINITY_DN27_c0_g1_i1:178-2451(-)
MADLKTKISQLFQLSPSTQFVITYVDEDHDIVTMEDDNDLIDALNQGLNPLRLDVSLKYQSCTSKDKRPLEEPSNSFTPSEGWEQFQGCDQPNLSPENISKVLQDILGKAVLKQLKNSGSLSAYPDVMELLAYIARTVGSTSTDKGPGEEASNLRGCSDGREQNRESDPRQNQESDLRHQFLRDMLKVLPDATAKSFGKYVEQSPFLSKVPEARTLSEFFAKFANAYARQHETQQSDDVGVSSEAKTQAPSNGVPAEQGPKNVSIRSEEMPNTSTSGERSANKNMGDENKKKGPSEAEDKISLKNMGNENKNKGCSKTEDKIPLDYRRPGVHIGVTCDSCGMIPIVGSRYKSLSKENHDLCQTCFSGLGNDSEYVRLDTALYRRPRSFKGGQRGRFPFPGSPFHAPFAPVGHPPFAPVGHPPFAPVGHPPFDGRPSSRASGKFDSRFVQDVTIFDGTQLAPGTPFVKIWRLRNNGTLPWPYQTKLVRVGGDDLGATDAVTLQVGEKGYPLEGELDVAVDFVAPMQPGRYVSYWRLMAPSGQKFGQRVWVLIQVLPQGEEPFTIERLPRKGNEYAINMNPIEVVAETSSVSRGEMDYDDYSPTLHVEQLDFTDQFNSDGTSGNAGTNVDCDHVDHANVSASPLPAEIETDIDGNITVEECNLLRDLEEMGFTDKARNLELLRTNDYDIMKTLEDLCAAADWDPLLEELQEMGFHDVDTNKRLLIKNEGSVKRVVLDLVSREKDASSGTSSQSKKAKQS